jgi:hypothetical protein
MPTALDQPAMIKHQYLVCIHNCRQSMRDHQSGAIGSDAVQFGLYRSLRSGIQCRRRFIEHENRRILEQCTRYCHTLFLPA